MKLAHIIKQMGRKAFYGIVFLAIGLLALVHTRADLAPSIVTLTLGIYGMLIGGHVYTDAKAMTVKSEGKGDK